MYQSSPGGQSSCSSERSPLGSTTNNDSGVEMAIHSGGSLGDLCALDDPPVVDSTGSPGTSAGVGLQLRKNRGVVLHLDHIKKEKLKTIRDSCSWTNSTPQVRNTKLPPIPAVGEYANIRCIWNAHTVHKNTVTLSENLFHYTFLPFRFYAGKFKYRLSKCWHAWAALRRLTLV